jgi:GntR family transcriptional repressor for pyruvate dehydrogenase complex
LSNPQPEESSQPRFAVQSLDASEHIALEIRRYVERQQLRPGDRLGTEQELAAEFGVSRPTLREAVRLLSGSHLLRTARGRSGGIFVAGTPIEGLSRNLSASIATMLAADSVSIHELFEMRTFLEIPVASLAAQRGDESFVRELELALAEIESDVPGSAAFGHGTVRFHRLLARAAGNELLIAFTDWILDVLQPLMAVQVVPFLDGAVVSQQYRAIYGAVKAHRPKAAERAMAAHYSHILAILDANIEVRR